MSSSPWLSRVTVGAEVATLSDCPDAIETDPPASPEPANTLTEPPKLSSAEEVPVRSEMLPDWADEPVLNLTAPELPESAELLVITISPEEATDDAVVTST
jgi:hypothetical protein